MSNSIVHSSQLLRQLNQPCAADYPIALKLIYAKTRLAFAGVCCRFAIGAALNRFFFFFFECSESEEVPS
jgi:hypothetical protein